MSDLDIYKALYEILATSLRIEKMCDDEVVTNLGVFKHCVKLENDKNLKTLYKLANKSREEDQND